MIKRLLYASLGVCLFVQAAAFYCEAAQVVFVRLVNSTAVNQQEVEAASRFYGVNLRVVTVGNNSADGTLDTQIARADTLAVAIDADALTAVDGRLLLRALAKHPGTSIPVLIVGVNSPLPSSITNAWGLHSGVSLGHLVTQWPLKLAVDNVDGVTKQLSDRTLPSSIRDVFYFRIGSGERNVQRVAAVEHNHQYLPTFIRVSFHGYDLFLAGKTGLPKDGPDDVVATFSRWAPAMMFIKYAAGSQGWHAAYHYANLTIDDPWLRTPYGYLNYKNLLTEMQKHNFHTTIAFIPWNFGRSRPEVVSLFRKYPDRLSISIHGDNHDHYEFPALGIKPLADQEADLREALDRMARFQELTGIPYDKVMIFPHNIGSEEILEALKTYNFLATVNSSNVPLGGTRPTSPLFVLRPVTMSWANFPSVSRVSAELPNVTAYAAVSAFLGNPLLFYCHQDFFARSIGAFNRVAGVVNSIEPDTHWASLGEIARHLYLIKSRPDMNDDVLSFSNEISLDNPSGRDAVFYIRKAENGSAAVGSVTADLQPIPFSIGNGFMDIKVSVPAGARRVVTILYTNAFHVNPQAASHHSLRVYFLRTISDFRDIALCRYAGGQGIITFYYDGRRHVVVGVIGFSIAIFVTVIIVLVRRGLSKECRELSSENRNKRVTSHERWELKSSREGE